jgi:2-polyprenyl-3-methyl-5-hydroxy-6-metoxy-1,4-benzoquinol methylase
MDSERIEAVLQAVKGTDILNLGCVNHSVPSNEAEKKRWLHARLQEKFPSANVLGLDIDHENVARMRSLGMNAEVGDAERLSYRAQFDTIILGEILEHLANPGACLEGCRQALKPGGRLVISTPNIFSAMLTLMYLKNFDRAFNREHVVWFCAQTLRALVERCGFQVESFRFVDDLAPDVVRDTPYRLFTYAWLAIRWLFPRRYRNTMVAVCFPSKEKKFVSTDSALPVVAVSNLPAHASQP